MNRLDELEHALDQGRLYLKEDEQHMYKLRRNGKTKTWKTRPNDFRIPVKYKFNKYGVIDHRNANTPALYILR